MRFWTQEYVCPEWLYINDQWIFTAEDMLYIWNLWHLNEISNLFWGSSWSLFFFLFFIFPRCFRLFMVRGKFYELLMNCIPPEIILKVMLLWLDKVYLVVDISFIFVLFQRLLSELLKKLDSELKHEVCHWAAYYVSYKPCNNLFSFAIVLCIVSYSCQ